MRLRVQTLLAAALVLAVLLTGCGRAANGNKSYAYTTAEDAYAPGASNESVTESAATRQVIITAGYSVEVKDFSAAAEALEKLTAQHSGYTEQANCLIRKVRPAAAGTLCAFLPSSWMPLLRD